MSANPFTDFVDTFGMVDLEFSGNPYTWSNHRQGEGIIKEHLDRSLALSNWIRFFPSYSISHLSAHSSDHNPLLLNTTLTLPTLPKPFRFEEFWTRDPTCDIVIQEAWSTPIEGSSSYCLSKKLKFTKQSIKYWNNHYFGDIRSKLDHTLKLLDAVQRDTPSDSNLTLELHLHTLMDEYLLQGESLWRTKSRELCLTSVDLNTKFFHTSTLIRRRRNSTVILQSPNSGWLTKRIDIGACFINNFKNLFTTSNPALPIEFMDLFDCSVSENDNTLLCA